ncbi:MAG: hypothetical protein Kow0069_25740 [Promethearchaeota archaeon]
MPKPKFKSVGKLEGEHDGTVNSLRWSPNGKYLASTSSDQTARVWYASGKKDPRVFSEKGTKALFCAEFDGRGKRVALGAWDGHVRIWRWKKDELVAKFERHRGAVHSVAWSPDGRLVASTSTDQRVRVWDVSSKEALHTLDGHGDGVMSVAWSPDGTRLVSGSNDKALIVWDPVRGSKVSTLKGHKFWITSVEFSPDGRYLASAGWDRKILVWDFAKEKVVQTITGHEGQVWSIAWSPDGEYIASGSSDKTLRVWRALKGYQVFDVKGDHDFSAVAWSPDGNSIAAGTSNGSILLWSVKGVQGVTPTRPKKEHATIAEETPPRGGGEARRLHLDGDWVSWPSGELSLSDVASRIIGGGDDESEGTSEIVESEPTPRDRGGLVGPHPLPPSERGLTLPFPAYSGSDPYIFASYAHDDARKVYPFLQRIKDGGVPVWYDEGIPPSEEWVPLLAGKIRGCAILCAFLSKHAVKSRWVAREVEFADLQRKPIVVVRLDEKHLPDRWQFLVGGVQHVFANDPRCEEKLLRTLRKHVQMARDANQPETGSEFTRNYEDEND